MSEERLDSLALPGNKAHDVDDSDSPDGVLTARLCATEGRKSDCGPRQLEDTQCDPEQEADGLAQGSLLSAPEDDDEAHDANRSTLSAGQQRLTEAELAGAL